MAGSPVAHIHDFRIGPIHVRPAARAIESSKGSFVTEPLVMQLLVELSRKAGRVVTRREIFERCWGSAPVGDDSLNRIVAALRRILSQADGETVWSRRFPARAMRFGCVRTAPGRLRRTPARPFRRVSTASALGFPNRTICALSSCAAACRSSRATLPRGECGRCCAATPPNMPNPRRSPTS